MNVRNILKDYIEKQGFDGLCNVDYECACDLHDFAPCDNLRLDCEIGYKKPSEDSEFPWQMTPEKPKEAQK